MERQSLVSKLGFKDITIRNDVIPKEMPLNPGPYSSCVSSELMKKEMPLNPGPYSSCVSTEYKVGSKQMPLIPGYPSSCISKDTDVVLQDNVIYTSPIVPIKMND